MRNSKATCQVHARLELDSTLDSEYKLDSLDRETRQKLDSSRDSSTAIHVLDGRPGTCSQPLSLNRLDRNSTVSTGMASTAPRQPLVPRRSLDTQLDSSTGSRRAQLGLNSCERVMFPFPRRLFPPAVRASRARRER